MTSDLLTEIGNLAEGALRSTNPHYQSKVLTDILVLVRTPQPEPPVPQVVEDAWTVGED